MNTGTKPVILATLLLALAAGRATAVTPADLKWDLSYRTARQSHPISPQEFMQFWPRDDTRRPVHEAMAAYQGEPIEAALLIEQPDLNFIGTSAELRAAAPLSTWIVKTRRGAQLCVLQAKRPNEPCQQLDPQKAEDAVRAVLAFRPMPPNPAGGENMLDEMPDGTPLLINYRGFVSVYADGVAMQRAFAMPEWMEGSYPAGPPLGPDSGRLQLVLARLTLSEADFAKHLAQLDVDERERRFDDAVERGDERAMAELLDADAGPGGSKQLLISSTPITRAIICGQMGVIEFLLRRGAKIDAGESAALKRAVEADNADMVEFLLSKGAKVDPPKDSLGEDGKVGESALARAVDLHYEAMARLLIRRGADVNLAQSRPVLSVAAGGNDYALTDLLLKSGARPNELSEGGRDSAIHYALRAGRRPNGWGKSAAQLERQAVRVEQTTERIVRRLVAGGANPNLIDGDCRTAYSMLDGADNPKLKTLLLRLGADPALHLRCELRRRAGR